MSFAKSNVVAIATVALVAGSSLQAAIIPVARNGSSAGDRTLVSDTLPRGTETGATMQVGEQSGDGTANLRSYVPFLITAADKADIATTGATATLFLRLNGFSNAGTNAFSVVGYTNRGTDVIGSGNDYSINPTTPVVTNVGLGTGIYNLDVTTFVRSQAAITGNTAIVFRIEAGSGLVKADGLPNQIVFKTGDNNTTADRPTLTIAVPEPASLGGVGLLSVALLRRRRASK